MSSYERDLIQYEAARNKAMKEWFDARKHIRRDRENEFLFEAGFRMAWDLRKSEGDNDE